MCPSGRSKSIIGTIRTISSALVDTLDVSEVLQQIVCLTVEELSVKGCAIRLLNPRSRQFDLSASWGLSQNYLEKGPIEADKSIEPCMNGEVVQIPDVSCDPRIQYPEEAKAEGIVSVLSLPMVKRDKTIGVFRIYASEFRQYADDEIDLLLTLADLGTLTLEHARLFSILKQAHDSLAEDFQNWFNDGINT
jgi:signal transduction protein with GAF and PtsI domain